MGFFERMLGGFAMGHHGRRSGGRHGGGYGGYDNRKDSPAVNRPDTTPVVACGKCSAHNRAGARFCEQCGASITGAPCGGCGAQVAPGAKFCAACGRPT